MLNGIIMQVMSTTDHSPDELLWILDNGSLEELEAAGEPAAAALRLARLDDDCSDDARETAAEEAADERGRAFEANGYRLPKVR